MAVYVEIQIQGTMDEVWEKTQSPALHERWDVRFTSIRVLEETAEGQRLRYSTSIGCGLAIEGDAESTARWSDQGRCASSLRFKSDDFKSLIREAAGHWQYTPVAGGVRFASRFHYETRYGWAGRVYDRLVFRPLMGWATAWSFDRLRLWVEQGIDPAISMQRSIIHAVCRIVVALVWLYQGLVPKLLARHVDECKLIAEAGVPSDLAMAALFSAGALEIGFGMCVLAFHRRRWPFVWTVGLMTLATAGVSISSPQFLIAAFNPLTFNLLLAAVSLVGLLAMKDLPSARRCRRSPTPDTA